MEKAGIEKNIMVPSIIEQCQKQVSVNSEPSVNRQSPENQISSPDREIVVTIPAKEETPKPAIEAKPKIVEAVPKYVDPRAIGNYVIKQNPFNGMDGHVENDNISLKASSSVDPGLAIDIKELKGGVLSFIHKGTMSGGSKDGLYLIQFIKSDPDDFHKDKILGQEDVITGNEAKAEAFQIPEGTDKIVIMTTGSGNIDVEMTKVIILPDVTKKTADIEIAKTQETNVPKKAFAEFSPSFPEELNIFKEPLKPTVTMEQPKPPQVMPANEDPAKLKMPCRTVIIPPANGGVYIGAHLGNNTGMKEVEDFEVKTGAHLNFVVSFWSIPPAGGRPFVADENIFNDDKRILFIKEQPGNWANNDRSKPEKMITLSDIVSQLDSKNGPYYEKYVDFAKWAKDFGHPLFLSLGHEMNGSWYSWGTTGTTPEEYKKYFRLAHDLMLENGANNITFVYNPDLKPDTEQKDYDKYFPGAGYVDWVGLDVYQGRNHNIAKGQGDVGKWKNADTLFESGVKKIRENPLYKGLPIMIAEYGRNRQSLDAPKDVTKPEDATITSAIDYITKPNNEDGVDALVYFDIDNEQGEWALKDKNLDEFKTVLGKHKANLSSVVLSEQKDGAERVLTEKGAPPK